MYHVYVLKSQVNGYLYVGSCEDLRIRLRKHNSGLVRSTQAYRPWRLVTTEEYPTRGEAVKRERFLKTGQQKELLKEQLKDK